MVKWKDWQQSEGGQAAISAMTDVDGTFSGSLLESILPTLLKK